MNIFIRFYASLFFGRRFYIALVGIIALFVLSYGIPFLFVMAQAGFFIFSLLLLFDYLILFSRAEPVFAQRILAERFNNGDQNEVLLTIDNNYPFTIGIKVIDELPDQFQNRNFLLSSTLKPNGTTSLVYRLRPVERGEYFFHNINVFVKSPVKLIVRRRRLPAEAMVKVFPSSLLIRHYALIAHSNNLAEAGSKKMRKIGHSLEFEQIREYVTGDDVRSLNWKATARKGGQLMVNNYTDEKSQQVYCVIDKGRAMKMPFAGMTLLDHAINTALILSNVTLIKQDKAGLISFADQVGTFLPAGRKTRQMAGILESLYNQQTKFLETDYEKLYAFIRVRITQRSLVVLFTNFESMSALQRQLPYIRSIARNHLLLLIFFENTELKQVTGTEPANIESLYIKTIAEKFAYEKG